MNLHPIFVHFPIAFLTVYTALEIVRVPVLTQKSWLLPMKAVLLIVGILGAGASLLSGETAAEALRGTSDMPLVQLHERYAKLTTIAYGLPALLYAMECLHLSGIDKRLPAFLNKRWQQAMAIHKRLFTPALLIIAALAGMLFITVTGALGGALVYGPEVDPVVSFFYHLLYKR